MGSHPLVHIKDMAATREDSDIEDEENWEEKSNLLGGESKKNEDDFFLSGPRINISSLRSQLEDRGAEELNFPAYLERVQFKTWKDNCLLKSVVCLALTVVIIIIFVVVIHNNIF